MESPSHFVDKIRTHTVTDAEVQNSLQALAQKVDPGNSTLDSIVNAF